MVARTGNDGGSQDGEPDVNCVGCLQQNDWERSARLVLNPRPGLQVAYVMVDPTATTQIRKTIDRHSFEL